MIRCLCSKCQGQVIFTKLSDYMAHTGGRPITMTAMFPRRKGKTLAPFEWTQAQLWDGEP